MGNLMIGTMMLGGIMTNGYFLHKEGSSQVLFVDPGDMGEKIYNKLTENGLEVKAILVTHAHYDHMMGIEALKANSGAPVYACIEEKEFMQDPTLNMSYMTGRPCSIEADVWLSDGEETELAGIKFRTIHTPGHTPGGCCFYFEEDGILISGDTLFEESVGRTDFRGGSMSALIRSIKDKLFVLPDETEVLPGHGSSTTIGREKKYNPFVSVGNI